MSPSQESTLSQSRAMSLAEALTNVVAGYCIALVVQLLVFVFLDLRLSILENATIAGLFTIVSVARSYCLRRLFDGVHRRSLRA